MKNQKGMTLVELMLALTMLTVASLGVAGFTNSTNRWFVVQKQTTGIQQDYDYALDRAVMLVQDFMSHDDNTEFELKLSFDQAEGKSTLLLDSDGGGQLMFEAGYGDGGYLRATHSADGASTVIPLLAGTLQAAAFVPTGSMVDDGARNGCLAAPSTSCFSNSCGSPSNLDFEVGACILSSTFPFFQISQDGDILYFSIQVMRNNTTNGLTDQIGMPMTKAVSLSKTRSRSTA